MSVAVIVPRLTADHALEACLDSLQAQTYRDVQIIVVDNSARKLARPREGVTVIHNDRNVGFGAAVNQGIRAAQSTYIATLNDDAVAHPNCLEALVRAAEQRHEIGMCAPQIRLSGDRLDSAGMLVCGDASSKQRGHLEPPSQYARPQHALFPSGCAALYKREMLDEIGLFDESFFLYCEDTDLGLRARWAAWECVYVPDAIVEHRYSHSAGAASPLKAQYVERNRLYVLAKNFPASMIARAPAYTLLRYAYHAAYAFHGRGAAGAFERKTALPLIAARAHLDLLRSLPRLRRERKRIRRRLTSKQFRRLLSQYSIGPRQVAAL